MTFDIGDEKDISFIEAMCDSDFAGLWNVENNADPVSSKSRTGFAMFVGGCPVVWQSKLQGETALSTTEAEIVALSQCMRDLLAARQATQDAAETLGSPLNPTVKIRAKVYEDNNGAISFAHKTGATSRTKHIHTKNWFFKEHIGEEEQQMQQVRQCSANGQENAQQQLMMLIK